VLDVVLTQVGEPSVLPPTTYDAELDNIISLHTELCDHLQELACLEFAVTVGSTHLPVDVGTDLCTLLGQLPRAIRASSTGIDCDLDFFEQGIETFLHFEFRDAACLLTAFSYRHPIAFDEAPIDPVAIVPMLERVLTTFTRVATHASPERMNHPWTVAWLCGD
jgi:hypothetical protein